MKQKIVLPTSFPSNNYVPYGYIDNTYHTAVINRSGIIRSVPPIGFGFWCRRLPFAYGEGAQRNVNYLSILHLSLNINGVPLHTENDFRKQKIQLVSKYHTKTMMSYDWEFKGLIFSAKYFLATEHSLVCIFEMENGAELSKEFSLFATNVYGFPETKWWGSDGVTGYYNEQANTAVSKIWAYGDMFTLSLNVPIQSHKVTADRDEWEEWIEENDFLNTGTVNQHFPGAVYNVLGTRISLPAKSNRTIQIVLSRGVNEKNAFDENSLIQSKAIERLAIQLLSDENFYQSAPMVVGMFPDEWKQGWIYDFETVRTMVRNPIGIYKHRWDAMQAFTPRVVLGETMLDMMCLSYVDIKTAQEVIYGTFADSPAPNIPCSREDGSMNMIGESGEECGTAPTWGLPFFTIVSIFKRTGDIEWIRALYPYLKTFLQWWLGKRTDDEGWFHCDNSWESGQDGSRRFLLEEKDEGAKATYVRTVDVEAAMAAAFQTMTLFARIAGEQNDVSYWKKLADERIQRSRSMYVDGWFRDFDARTDKPIILKNYFDVMMLMPVALNIATPEQVEGVRHMFKYFEEHPRGWLEWPSFMYPFSEAAYNAGKAKLLSNVLYATAQRVYKRICTPKLSGVGKRDVGLPEEYNYRIPGVACEFWPIELEDKFLAGSENYGWGATLPMFIIRYIIGYRELENPEENAFILSPAIPDEMLKQNGIVGMRNLQFREKRFDVEYMIEAGDVKLAVVKIDGKEAKYEVQNFQKIKIEMKK